MKRLFLLFSAGAALLSGCGGGGGGGFSGAAFLEINAEPRVVDVGDQLQVEVTLSDVHEDGIILKIRFPTDLTYVNNSAIVEVDEDEIDLAPAVNAEADNNGFIVFFLSHDTFGEEEGKVIIELEGKAENDAAKIEVDADVDNPDISNDVEFNIEEPEFSAEDEVHVEVSG